MFKLNPITGKMDLIRSISDNPESNTQDEAASTKATKIIADNLENEIHAREATDATLNTLITDIEASLDTINGQII